MRSIKFINCLLLCLLPLFATTAVAENGSGLLKVELIVFKQPNANSQRDELWSDNPGEPSSREAIDLRPWQQPALAYMALPRSSWQLGGAEHAMANRGYQILAHLAWLQPRVSGSSATAVNVGSNGGSSDLSGFANVTYSRFPHVAVDMLYKNGRQSYRFTESKRVNLNKIQYLDHPVLGALVKVSAVE